MPERIWCGREEVVVPRGVLMRMFHHVEELGTDSMKVPTPARHLCLGFRMKFVLECLGALESR